MEKPELSLVLPAYNEGENLKNTVANIIKPLEREGVSFEIVVVNNGSSDNTEEVLKSLVSNNKKVVPVHLEVNQGYGGGILEGLKKSTGKVIGWSDADGQINPEDIVNLYKRMKANSTEAAKAVRAVRRERLARRVQSFFFNVFFQLMFRSTAWDVNAKPKLMKRELFEKFPLKSRNYFIDAEWVIRLTRANISITEVPVEFLKRSHGKSKIHVLAALSFVKDMILFKLNLR